MTDYINVKVPGELAILIDKIVEKRAKGYRSRGEFVAMAVREKLKEFEAELARPRFSHLNVHEDHVTLMDNDADKIAEIYFQNGKAYCSLCEEHDCDHTRFALSLPKVEKALREKGWVIEDGKIIRGPG